MRAVARAVARAAVVRVVAAMVAGTVAAAMVAGTVETAAGRVVAARRVAKAAERDPSRSTRTRRQIGQDPCLGLLQTQC